MSQLLKHFSLPEGKGLGAKGRAWKQPKPFLGLLWGMAVLRLFTGDMLHESGLLKEVRACVRVTERSIIMQGYLGVMARAMAISL